MGALFVPGLTASSAFTQRPLRRPRTRQTVVKKGCVSPANTRSATSSYVARAMRRDE